MKHIIRHIPSLLLGACFVVSGWLKGVDPYGTSLKLSEYFRVWGWSGFVADHPLAWSVCLCAGELCLGLLLLSGVFRKAVAWGAVAVRLYHLDGLAGFLAHGDVGAGLRLLRRGIHVGARGHAAEKHCAVGFGPLASVGRAGGAPVRPERMAYGLLLCGLFLGSSPLLGGVASPGGFPAFRPWGGFACRAGFRSV